MSYQLVHADCLDFMREMADGCVDMTITSPPYTDQRTYGIGFKLSGQGWVDWCIPRILEMCRVTRGIVFFNAAGPVKDFKYQPVVEWLVADLTRKHGIVCGPAPYVFHRVGIPGSGGPHYHRRDWEPVYAFALPQNLPPRWSDNTATGAPPKRAPGGAMSARKTNGERVNGAATRGKKDGDTQTENGYDPPEKANSGNKIMRTYTTSEVAKIVGETRDILELKVGGGQMGSDIAHESEAPFPEALVRFFIVSFCPPGGTVLDPFSGSGTTVSVAIQEDRNAIGIDIRDGEGGLASARKRLEGVTPKTLFA